MKNMSPMCVYSFGIKGIILENMPFCFLSKSKMRRQEEDINLMSVLSAEMEVGHV